MNNAATYPNIPWPMNGSDSNTCRAMPVGCAGGATRTGSAGCVDGQGVNYGGGAWISTNYIRNRGETSFPTAQWDAGYQDEYTNNPAPTTIFVRCAVSQLSSPPTKDCKYSTTRKVLWVNGLERPRIILTRGKKYQFNVMTCGDPFFFTTDPTGGHGVVGHLTNIKPADYIMSTITAGVGTPDVFYYQSPNVSDMGGMIVIKD